MTRMIERWFPCAEVSENSNKGWGSGNTERNLFTWFAARPIAQAKAAVITSLLPWPEDEAEQKRLQSLVREAMSGRYAALSDLRAEIIHSYPSGARVLDPFSGRGTIPLEAARLGVSSNGLDYSPVAVLASELLTNFLFKDWSAEPSLPFGDSETLEIGAHRLLNDVERVLKEVGKRHSEALNEFYPKIGGQRPWGYLWSVTLPCRECNRRFPLVGSLELRKPSRRRIGRGEYAEDPGQSYYFEPDYQRGTFRVVIHGGPPMKNPTLISASGANGKKIPGKSAVCVFCSHIHPLEMHRSMTNDRLGRDALLVVGEHDEAVGKIFRLPTDAELEAASQASSALRQEAPFSPFVPSLPDEEIGPGNNNIIGPSIYGARTYGDFMCDRQSLSFIRLSRIIASLGVELQQHGISADYSRALTGYAAANMVRMLRYSTRGAWLRARNKGTVEVAGIFVNEGSLSFSYDFFEAGIGQGPGTWNSVQASSLGTLKSLMPPASGSPVVVERGTATSLPYASLSFEAVVTDPPYDEMIAYADSSDLFYAWLKRALSTTWPELGVTSEVTKTQEKADEIIVKRTRGLSKSTFRDHRTREHYDTKIAEAFREMRRVVKSDGLVTIVFGHGEPEVWQRLLNAIDQAGLIMTASWPARTESGGQQGKANIETTLTMACRPAPTGRSQGRKAAVEAEVKAAVKERMALWERSGLAPTDMLMAAAGPAMEVIGKYSEVLDSRGEPVDIYTFVPLARQAVQEAMAVEIDHHPLEVFDARTRFALWWARVYGRQVTPKPELRWQALTATMNLAEVRDLVPDADKGCCLVQSSAFKTTITPDSSVIDVILAMAKSSEDGLEAVSEVLVAAGRDADDAYPWAAMRFLADRLPDSDPDAIAWTRILRNRAGVGRATHSVRSNLARSDRRGEQSSLFE